MWPRRAVIALPVVGAARGVRAEGGWADLPAAFAAVEASRGGRLGVAVLDSGTGRVAAHRGDERFPLASTFKLLLAGAVLARIDAGAEQPERAVRFSRADLVPWSPVTEPALDAGALPVSTLPLLTLIEAVLVTSDNTAANLLLASIGGPPALTAFLRGLGDGTTRLDRIEPALNEATPGDPRDSTTPRAMLHSLRALTLGDVLAPDSRATLLAGMRANRAGVTRLRAGVPATWEVADRTGTAGHRTSNVVGVLWPPAGRAPIVVAAYLTEGAAEAAVRDAALADIARLVSTAA